MWTHQRTWFSKLSKMLKKDIHKSPLKFSNTSNTTAPGLGMTRLGCNWKSQQKAKKNKRIIAERTGLEQPGGVAMKNGMRCQINDWQPGFFRTGKGIPKTKPARLPFAYRCTSFYSIFGGQPKILEPKTPRSPTSGMKSNSSTGWTYLQYGHLLVENIAILLDIIYFQRLLNKSSTLLLLSSNTIRPGNTWNGIANHVHCDTMSSTFQRNGWHFTINLLHRLYIKRLSCDAEICAISPCQNPSRFVSR